MRRALVILAATTTLLGCSSSPESGPTGGAGGGGGEGGTGGLGYVVGLEILGVSSMDAECVFTVDPSRFLPEGSWDLDAPGDYYVGLAVENLFESDTSHPDGLELNRVHAQSIQVTLLDADGNALDLGELPNPYLTTTSQVIDPASDRSSGWAPVVGIAIPSGFREGIRDLSRLLLELETRGAKAGGEDVRSSAFRWPLALCAGCLGEACDGVEPDDACLPGQNGEPWCVGGGS